MYTYHADVITILYPNPNPNPNPNTNPKIIIFYSYNYDIFSVHNKDVDINHFYDV